jgi:FixJ family two-component response regulator
MHSASVLDHESRSPMSHATPTVFVVDDDVSVRESLELLIRCAGWQPETFASAEEFLARPRLLAPSCLILDVSLPDLNGLDLQKRIGADRVDMPIIFITGHGDVPMTVQAMEAGAVEFLTKPFGDEVLLSAIRHAIERSHTALDHEAEMRALRDCYDSLSHREREVMALVVSGLLNKQVGSELGISEITVKAHRGSVMRKMKADSLADLVNMPRNYASHLRRKTDFHRPLVLRFLFSRPLFSTPPYAGPRTYLIPRYRPTPSSNRFAPTHLLQSRVRCMAVRTESRSEPFKA